MKMICPQTFLTQRTLWHLAVCFLLHYQQYRAELLLPQAACHPDKMAVLTLRAHYCQQKCLCCSGGRYADTEPANWAQV